MIYGPQVHLILNHLPIVAFLFLTPISLILLFKKRVDYRRLALLAVGLAGLMAIPANLTGESAEEAIEDLPGISEAQIERHEEAAELAMIAAIVSGGLSFVFFAWARSDQRLGKVWPIVTSAVILTTGLMARAGHEGGKIRHPEIGDSSLATPGVTAELDEDDTH